MLYDPYRAGGLPATDGPSGPRPGAPEPTRTAENADGGPIDRLALSGIEDIEDFWNQNYAKTFDGSFEPVSELISYDSTDPQSPIVCRAETYERPNALYCPPDDVIAWDRGSFVPAAREYYGDMAVNGVLAHEYGHALQRKADLVDNWTPGLIAEQQADCFAGVYMRWVAEGKSPRFTLSTTDDLDRVLAGAITLRDPLMTEEESEDGDPHGNALDRVSAFQIGFDVGANACAAIDMTEIEERRGELPVWLESDSLGNVPTGEAPLDEDTLSTLMELLGVIFAPSDAPTLSTDPADCSDAESTEAASYCPATDTIYVDLPALQQMGAAADEGEEVLLQGDNSALSVVTSRYALAVQRERGASLDSPETTLRTACLTGVGQAGMAEPIDVPSGNSLVLTAGDVDEAVSGLLTNGLAASDVNGVTAPAGFTRILAYRSGLSGDADLCFQRFA